MQVEHYVSTVKIVAVCLWALVGVLTCLSWVVVINPGLPTDWGWLLALTAGVIAPAAAVAHIKMYAMKITCLIRVASKLPLVDDDEVSSPAGLRAVSRGH